MTKRKNLKSASSRAAGHRVDHPFHQRSFAMTSTIDLIALPHVPRELLALVEAGETVPPYRSIWLRACNGELPMAQFVRGRWYVARDQLPELAQTLGLRLKRPARPRASTRRSAA
jgi:hypothetical protein